VPKCPISNPRGNCPEDDRCAWWMGEDLGECCAIYSIAFDLNNILTRGGDKDFSSIYGRNPPFANDDDCPF